MKKIFLFLIIILITGCSNGKSYKNSLEIYTWWASEESNPLKTLINLYKEKYPDVTVINSTVAGGAGFNARTVLYTRIQAGDSPDTFLVHGGHDLIDSWVIPEKMEPVTFLFNENNNSDAFREELIEIISYKGDIYSVPMNIHRSNMLWYNIDIFEKNKIALPETMEQFFEILELLSERGVIPLALGDNGIWASSHLFESLLLAELGPDDYKGLWTDAELWSSEGVRNAVETFLRILNYVNTDHSALTWEQASRYVADGRAAMNIMGDWSEGFFVSSGYQPGIDFGWIPTPGTEGVFMMLSDTFGLPKGAPFKENAVKWLRLCVSKEGQDIFNPLKGSIPSRLDCDRELYDIYIQSAMEDFQEDIIVPSVCHGAAASEKWINEINNIIGTLIIEKNIDNAVMSLIKISHEILG